MDAVSQFRYRPAGGSGWLAVASADRLLVLHPSGLDTGIAVFERGDSSGQGFQVALDELTRGGLSATPPFALLEWSGDDAERALRVIVRGGVRAVVTAGGSEHTLDGTGVSTWTEQSFRQVTAFEVVVVPEPDAAFAGDRWLPLNSGITVVTRVASAHGAVVTAKPAPTPATRPVRVAAEVSEATVSDLPAGPEDAPSELDSNARPTDEGYDYHFGETMYRNVGDTSAGEASPVAEASGAPVGDHDGMTVMNSDLKKLRADRKTRVADAQAPAAPPATQLFLELSTGTRELLSQPVVVGRAPTASKVSSGALPRLVTIPGDKDISRNHAQVAVEGGTVVVTDLHSRNGTQVIMPGKPPQQLRQGEPTAVIVGTVIDLGGGVTLTVREEG